jgi:hypothetical protein
VAAVDEAPDSAEETPPAPSPAEPAPVIDTSAALAEALGGAPETPAPAGPPLTQGERDGLRVSVSRCWNLGALSTEALRTRVTIYMQMNEDGTPRLDTIRMVGFDGGPRAAADQAFEAGRRAIFQCGRDGYDLPPEKYAQWREIEMTFDPSEMRMR